MIRHVVIGVLVMVAILVGCSGRHMIGAVDPTEVDGGDGGGASCTGTEVCDGLDNDCNGRIDEGACAACRCEYWGSDSVDTTLPSHSLALSPRFRRFEVAFDGEDVLAFVTKEEPRDQEGPLWLGLRRLDGSILGTDRVVASDALQMIGVAWSGSRWVIAWATAGERTLVAALGSDGAAVAGPVLLDTPALGIAAVGDTTYLAYSRGVATFVHVLDAQLTGLDTSKTVVFPKMKDMTDIRAVGDAVAVVGAGEPGNTAYLGLLRNGVLIGDTELMQIAPTYAVPGPTSIEVAADTRGIVACWTSADGLWCRRISPVDVQPIGEAFKVLSESPSVWDIVGASCGVSIMTAHAWDSGPSGLFRIHHFDDSGTVETKTLDRLWVQPQRTMRALPARDGRLLRVLAGTDPPTVLLSNLRCRTPPVPITDCITLARAACACACAPQPEAPTECAFRAGATGFGFSKAECVTEMSERIRCDIVDAPLCQERLTEPNRCLSSGESIWPLPADCIMPR